MKYLTFIGIILFLFACQKNSRIPISDIITLDISKTVIPADNTSSLLLTAKIDAESDTREIHFHTNLGSFRNHTTLIKDTVITAGYDGVASIYLYSNSSQIGTALITAYASSMEYRAEITVTFQDPFKNQKMLVSLSDTSIHATNGQTFCKIYAKIISGPEFATVDFTTTKGSFLGSATNAPTKMSIPTDKDSTSTVWLLADTIPGIAYLTIVCGRLKTDTTVRFKR